MARELRRRGIRLVPEGLVVDGRPVPLRSAGFPYWVIPAGEWERVLDGAAALRLPVVRFDVPWALHEPAPGGLVWGESSAQLDLDRALALAHARGLLVWLRPGPWLGAPHATGGIPGWLLEQEEVRALDRSGRPLPLPSVASPRYAREARRWLETVVDRVAGSAYPNGPVLGLWVTETGPAPPQWPGGALDESPWAKAFLTRYRTAKYGPKGGADPEGERADRVEAGEVARRAPAEWARGIVGERPGLVLLAEVEDHPPGCGGDVEATRGMADVVGLAFPAQGALDYSDLRLIGLRAGALPPPAAVTQIPHARSLEAPPGELDPATAVLVLAMSGVRALDVRSLVPLGGGAFAETPLEGEGRLAPAGRRLGEVLSLLDAIEHPTLERRRECLLLVDRELARLREARAACASLPAGLGSPRALRALRLEGRPDLAELRADALFDGLFDGLRRISVPFGVADTSISAERLSEVRVVFASSFGRMSRPLAQRLFEWAADGGTLVIGPRLPELDWAGGPLGLGLFPDVKQRLKSFRVGNLVLDQADLYAGEEPVIETPEGVLAAAAPLARGRLVRFGFPLPFGARGRDADTLAWLVRRLADAAGLSSCYAPSDPEVETELHEGAVRRFLFLANPTSRARAVTIELGSGESLREVRGRGEHVRSGQPIPVPARSVLVREIVPL